MLHKFYLKLSTRFTFILFVLLFVHRMFVSCKTLKMVAVG